MQTILLVHGIVAVIAVVWMVVVAVRQHGRERRAAELLRFHGNVEGPPTLHPVIDADVCIGSGACVRACPEDRALVIVKGRAHLAQASGCIGHGECLTACPVDAITLVFGSARRGVDLPDLDPHFESSQPGVYIAGELGGMGLIATAVRQGVKAVGAIADSLKGSPSGADTLPLVIVGAGPAGIAAALTARERNLRFRLIEKEPSVGGAVRSYPRGKVVMTTPAELPLYGRVHLRRTTKAALIELWNDVLGRGEITPEFGVSLEAITRAGDDLVVATSTGPIVARRVLLATGRRGRPRHLGVTGEDLAHVRHNIDDPTEHDGERCLVVGGGDVALEAALALAERPDTQVTLCHRGEAFDRAKPALQDRLRIAEAAGLRVLRGAQVERITDGAAAVATAGGVEQLAIDTVFVLIGSDLPTELLVASGIRVQTHRGERVPLGAR
ncbi:MAG: NAD(P)-binding domain-containing protein [Proteobacteria bacterium]|nr:NAD(P)-binding domain-containing protein [Pseudomonadota bacterium]